MSPGRMHSSDKSMQRRLLHRLRRIGSDFRIILRAPFPGSDGPPYKEISVLHGALRGILKWLPVRRNLCNNLLCIDLSDECILPGDISALFNVKSARRFQSLVALKLQIYSRKVIDFRKKRSVVEVCPPPNLQDLPLRVFTWLGQHEELECLNPLISHAQNLEFIGAGKCANFRLPHVFSNLRTLRGNPESLICLLETLVRWFMEQREYVTFTNKFQMLNVI